MSSNGIDLTIRKASVHRLNECLRMVELAMAKVEEPLLWKLPTPKGMALGNQLLHICGNMRQYILCGLGDGPDHRKRSEEFTVQPQKGMGELMEELRTTVKEAIDTIEQSRTPQWVTSYSIQGFRLSGTEAVLHAIEHFAYHTGQIAFWIKLNTGKDLGFYAHHDLTQTQNKSTD